VPNHRWQPTLPSAFQRPRLPVPEKEKKKSYARSAHAIAGVF
jgi:hypothetical protein